MEKNKLITYKEFSKLWKFENNKGINFKELAYNEFMKKIGDKELWFYNKKKLFYYLKNIFFYSISYKYFQIFRH
jgi:hypothetical protein